MQKEQIAAQLFTIRDFTKTPEDIAESMKKIKAIGFDAVQVSALGPIEIDELKKILDGEGLKCCATHEKANEIINAPEMIVEKLKALDCEYTAYPHPTGGPCTEEAFTELAHNLNRSGEYMKKHGITLTYHNHAIELQRFGNRTGLDIIYSESGKENLQGEIDTYWIQYGGQNPAEWCRKMKNRLPLLHLKDYGMIKSEVHMFELGYGNLDWTGIIEAAHLAKTEWYIIEQDTCRFDPFESLKMSFNYLTENICE